MVKAIFLIFLFLISASITYASTAKVDIENRANINSNSTSSNKSNFNTDIRVETNGKVTEYHSNEPGKIEVKSENGVAEIKKDGQVVQGTSTQDSNPQASSSPNPTEPDDDDEKEESDEEEKEREVKTILERIADLFKQLFSLLR